MLPHSALGRVSRVTAAMTFQAADKKTLVLFDVDGTLTPARKVPGRDAGDISRDDFDAGRVALQGGYWLCGGLRPRQTEGADC